MHLIAPSPCRCLYVAALSLVNIAKRMKKLFQTNAYRLLMQSNYREEKNFRPLRYERKRLGVDADARCRTLKIKDIRHANKEGHRISLEDMAYQRR